MWLSVSDSRDPSAGWPLISAECGRAGKAVAAATAVLAGLHLSFQPDTAAGLP